MPSEHSPWRRMTESRRPSAVVARQTAAGPSMTAPGFGAVTGSKSGRSSVIVSGPIRISQKGSVPRASISPWKASGTAAAVPEAFQGEMLARGTEPFWLIRIGPETITLERPDFDPVTAPNPGAVMEGPAAVWRATTADGRRLSVILRQGECSDGMSDLRYAYVAEASLAGETLRGCAGKADAMPREGA